MARELTLRLTALGRAHDLVRPLPGQTERASALLGDLLTVLLAPYDDLGLPYHRHYEGDLDPIPAGKPFELVFDLLATSYLFQAGHRIRVTVAFADADNLYTPVLDPPPTLKLLRNTRFTTCIELPVVHDP